MGLASSCLWLPIKSWPTSNMKEAAEIMALSPEEGEALQAQLSSGGAPAARRYLLWCAWRQIRVDKRVPANTRPAVFRDLCKNIEVVLEAGLGQPR